MNRRQFLSTITAAPAIISSKGIFTGACDLWVPSERDLLVRQVIDVCRNYAISDEIYRRVMADLSVKSAKPVSVIASTFTAADLKNLLLLNEDVDRGTTNIWGPALKAFADSKLYK